MPFSKSAAPFDRFGIEPVDLVDADQAVILFALFGAADLAFDQIAAPQFEAADLRLADVDVVVADDVAGAAQESRSPPGSTSRMPLAISSPERALCAGEDQRRRSRPSSAWPALAISISSSRASLDSSALLFSSSWAAVSIGGPASACGKLFVKLLLVVAEVAAAARRRRRPPPAAVRASIIVGAMFGLQRSFSLVEPHTPCASRVAGGAAVAIEVGDVNVGGYQGVAAIEESMPARRPHYSTAMPRGSRYALRLVLGVRAPLGAQLAGPLRYRLPLS